MRLTLVSGLLGLAALGITHACDLSSDDDSPCGEFTACGGDIEGTWVVEETCWAKDLAAVANAELQYPAECGSVVTSVEASLAGTMNFDSDTQTGELTKTIESKYFYSAECIAALGSEAGSAVCASLAEGVAEGDVRSARCEYSDGGCACSTTYEVDVTLARVYSVSDGTITFTEDDSSVDFCVQGDALTMSDYDTELAGIMKLRRSG